MFFIFDNNENRPKAILCNERCMFYSCDLRVEAVETENLSMEFIEFFEYFVEKFCDKLQKIFQKYLKLTKFQGNHSITEKKLYFLCTKSQKTINERKQVINPSNTLQNVPAFKHTRTNRV